MVGYWFPRAFILENGFIPARLVDSFWGGPGVVMLVNYHHSEVGPYQELLFMPGRFRYQGRRFSSITKIYVSTWASVVNGRHHWAIPKEMANFAWQTQDSVTHIHLSREGYRFASFAFKTLGPTLSVTSALIPADWRTLWQSGDAHSLFTRLQGVGRIKMARLLHAQIDPDFFPDITQGRLLAAGKFTHFEMTFPKASTSL